MNQMLTPKRNMILRNSYNFVVDTYGKNKGTGKNSMQQSPEVFKRNLDPAIKKKHLKQLSASINMMQYQQQTESSSDDEKPLRHAQQHWNHHEQGTELYKKEFPKKCWPMKHFRNFQLNQSDSNAIKQKQHDELIADLLSSDEETFEDLSKPFPRVVERVKRATYYPSTTKAKPIMSPPSYRYEPEEL